MRRSELLLSLYGGGDIASDEASRRVAELGVTFAEVWNWLGHNHQQLTFLLGMIGLLLTFYVSIWSDPDPEGDEELLRRQSEALEQIGEALRRLEVPDQVGPADEGSKTPSSGSPEPGTIA